MISMRIFVLIIILLSVPTHDLRAGGPDVISGPTGASGTSAISSLVQEALNRNPELKYYEALVAAAQGQRRQAGAWTNPELEVEGGYRRVEDLAGEELPSDGYTVGVSFTQTFEFPGKATLRKALAAQDVRQARLALAQFRLTLAGRVRQLALRYQSATAYAALTNQVSVRSGALVDLLRKRPLSGAKTLLEVRVIQASQLELAEEATQAKIERIEALAELNTLLSRPADSPLQLPSVIAPPPLVIYDPAQLNLLASRHNPLLRLREAEIEKARLTVDAARLEKMPDFSIGPFFSQDVAGEEETNIGVVASAQLPLWDRNEGAIVSAKARTVAARYLKLRAQRQVEKEVTSRWRIYQATRTLVAGLDPQTLSDLEAAAELADRQYRQGAVSVELYLESQRALLNSQKVYHQTVLRLWNSLLDLELMTGGKLAPVASPTPPTTTQTP